MMPPSARPRIDLDGVALVDEHNPDMVVAVFRYRTQEGLVLLVPESAEVTVPWSAVEATTLDLRSGLLHVALSEPYLARQAWLRGARRLVGRWMDRVVL